MILTCPSCATRFFVENEVFGSERRKVRCSRCRHTWHQDPLPEEWEPPAPPASQAAAKPPAAKPAAAAADSLAEEPWEPPPSPPAPPPRPPSPPPSKAQAAMPADLVPEPPLPPHISGFDDEDEDDLLLGDRPPLHPPLDEPPTDEEDPDAVLTRRRERLAQAGLQRPAGPARKKRSLAWMGWLLLIGLLGAVIGGGYEKRTELIGFYPPLAKLYEQLGIPVEAAEWLGLELHNLKSATVLEEGETKIAVSGEVANVGGTERSLPAIRIAMRGASGQELAAYTITLQQPRLGAEEKLGFDVKLPAPKEDVTDLEVAFANAMQP